MDRDVNGGPVSQNWLRQRFQTLNLSFTFSVIIRGCNIYEFRHFISDIIISDYEVF